MSDDISPAPVGRPSEFTQDIADTICDRLMNGESLRRICADAAMPGQTTVYMWLRRHADFRKQYSLAREVQADTLVDETLDIADDGSNDWMAAKDRDGGPEYNGDAVQRARLRIDARKWMAGKLAPKKYGDKLALTGGGDDDAPIRTVRRIERVIVDPSASDA